MLIPMKVDYGVRMLVHLALRPRDDYTTTAAIAREQNIPEAFLLRVSADLSRDGYLETRRGPGGGVKLAQDPADITVGDISSSVDHAFSTVDCIETPDACMHSTACSQRELWEDVEQMLQEYLSKITIAALAERQQSLSETAAIEFDVAGAAPVAVR